MSTFKEGDRVRVKFGGGTESGVVSFVRYDVELPGGGHSLCAASDMEPAPATRLFTAYRDGPKWCIEAQSHLARARFFWHAQFSETEARRVAEALNALELLEEEETE